VPDRAAWAIAGIRPETGPHDGSVVEVRLDESFDVVATDADEPNDG
jgi:hypothetical protein